MVKEYNFKFSELLINTKKIALMFGYNEDSFPESFKSSLAMAINFAEKLTDIKGAYLILDKLRIDQQNFTIYAGELKFDVGKKICKELKGAERVALYVCTAGKTISEESSGIIFRDDPILGYILDVMGTMLTEAVCGLLQSYIKKEVKSNEELTNLYCPGDCQWPVSDQHKLFTFFPENTCGISLSDSALMSPIKSVSGIIGIGENVKLRKCLCTLCSNKDCIYRKIRNKK